MWRFWEGEQAANIAVRWDLQRALHAILASFCEKGFRGGPKVRNPPANAGDMSSTLGLGRFHRATKPVRHG